MLEVLKEVRKQIGEEYDQLVLRPYGNYMEGKKDGLDLAWQIVEDVINKLEGTKENDR